MREQTNKQKIDEFMRAMGRLARQDAQVYFTGGSTAVIYGWRDTTVDIDLCFRPDVDELFHALPALKEKLHINIELASPPDFIPEIPGWQERSIFIRREGKIDFFHFDPYSQALAKLERGFSKDIDDVESMERDGIIEKERLVKLFREIESRLYRYPAIDPASFANAVIQFTEGLS